MTIITPSAFGQFDFGNYLFGGVPGGIGPLVPPLPDYAWQILVRNPDLTIAGPIEVTSLELHPQHNNLGAWFVTYAWDGDWSSPGGALFGPGAGIIVAVNNKVVLSGPCTKPIISRDGDARTLTAGGITDLQVIADRVASPQPGSSAPPYNLSAQDVRGPLAAETVIKGYVNVNAGPGAVAARRTPHLTIEADLARGSSVKAAASWQQLSDLVFQLALAGNVGVRVIQVAGPALQFQVYAPVDRSSEIVFGVEVGNASGYTYGQQRPAANYDFALGAGTGTARTVREGTDAVSAAAWGRIEGVVDQGSSSDTNVLNAAIAADLAERSAQYSVGINALDTAGHQWAAVATDGNVGSYDLGDTVTCTIEGQTIVQTINEIGVYFDGTGTRIVPVIGTPNFGHQGDAFFTAIVRQLRAAQQQLRDLQRR